MAGFPQSRKISTDIVISSEGDSEKYIRLHTLLRSPDN